VKRWTVYALLAVSLLVVPVTRAGPEQPTTPQSRLLDVWLDLNLLDIFYPETTPATFMRNLKKVARQLNQSLHRVKFGESPRDTLRAPAGTVVIKRHPPKETFILYTRSRTQVWELLDSPARPMRIFRVVVRK